MANHSRFDAASFVFGVVFVTVAVVGLLETSVLRTVNFAQLIPVVLIAAGLALLASTLRSRRLNADEEMATAPPQPPRL